MEARCEQISHNLEIPRLIVAHGAVFDTAGNVLLLRRIQNDPVRGGELDFPGGSADWPEETPVEVFIRECKEEAGISCSPAEVHMVLKAEKVKIDHLTNKPIRLVKSLFAAFPENPILQLPSSNQEHDEGFWLPPSEAAVQLKHLSKIKQRAYAAGRTIFEHGGVAHLVA